MNSIIPDGIMEIADAAFYGCSWLTDIDLPDSIIKIGKSAFYESGLTRVAIPEHVESIDNCAFDNCDALTCIIVPNSVKCVGNRAFTGSDYTFEKRYIFFAKQAKNPKDGTESGQMMTQMFIGKMNGIMMRAGTLLYDKISDKSLKCLMII